MVFQKGACPSDWSMNIMDQVQLDQPQNRLIQLSAITIDKQTIDYHKAEKTIVLDEPDIEIKVWTVERNVLGLSSQRIVSID